MVMRKISLMLIVIFEIIIFFTSFISVNSKTIIVPDEFSSIQSALNSASAHDTVLVKPGSYHEFLILKDSIVLMSDGVDDGNWNRATATIIHSEELRDSLGNVPPVVNCTDGAVINGFEITGMDTVNHHLPGHSHAVQNRGTSSTIINCIVHDNGSTGIGSHEKDGRPAVPTIIHNKVYRNFGIGIGFNHFSKGLAKDNIVYENREVGIGTQNGAAPLIESNIVYRNGWNGISARDGSKPIVRANTVYSNGIDRTGDEMPVGAGAGIGADSTGWVVKPDDETGPMRIEHNIVHDNPTGGIMARNNSLIYISNNTVNDNANFQIAINDQSEGVVDTNVVFITSGGDYSGGGIVVARNSNAEITGNIIYNTKIAGIAVSENCAVNVTGNRIDSCQQAGIRVDSTAYQVNIENNVINNNKTVGIYLVLNGAKVHRNLIANNVSGGISSDKTCSNHIYNNTIVSKFESAGRGIYAASDSSAVINNIIFGYTVGVFKENSPVIDYNCTFNNIGYNSPPGTGGQHAINANLEFVDINNDDYHLNTISPCINTGDPNPFYNDPDSSRANIGCYPYNGIIRVDENTVESELFIIYPAITTDYLTIKLLNENKFTEKLIINVYNLLGNKIDEIIFEGNQFDYNTSKLIAGLYFIRIQNGYYIHSKPFIKE
jgi:parallel beta-helix repeat protein